MSGGGENALFNPQLATFLRVGTDSLQDKRAFDSAAGKVICFFFQAESICNPPVCGPFMANALTGILVHVRMTWTYNDPPVVVLTCSILQQEGTLFYCLFFRKQSGCGCEGQNRMLTLCDSRTWGKRHFH
ncbi:MAG: hypothetical protein ACI4MP_11030 [Candidatus Ventricola sp.]